MKYPGTPVAEGSENAEAVRAIQARLGVQLTGVFGPTTEANVCRFQKGHGLAVDGVVGPRTWEALFSPEVKGKTVARLALQLALGYVGERERPKGSNRGPFVEECLRRTGLGGGHPWCMAFVFRCVEDAARDQGVKVPMPNTASCSALYRWAQQHGRLVAVPEPGDIFLCIGGERGHYHTGFVAGAVKDGRFPTVEGNSNDDGSAEGYEVAHRPQGRKVASCHYVRL
jgi:hypothetical protein